jgi:hypothetical protein
VKGICGLQEVRGWSPILVREGLANRKDHVPNEEGLQLLANSALPMQEQLVLQIE